MRGPNDPLIDAVASSVTAPGAASTIDAEAQRTPVAGGKALLRLFETLQRRGLASLADESVPAALPEAAREAYAGHAERLRPAPAKPSTRGVGGGSVPGDSATTVV